MRSPNRPVTRLGLALTAALLGLATVTAVATADPTDPTSSPPSSTAPAPQPPSSDPSPPPSQSPSPSPEAPAETTLADLQVTAKFDKPSYTTGEKITAAVTATNTGKDSLTTSGYFPWRADAITIVPETNPFRNVTLEAGESVTHNLTGAVGNAEIGTAKLYVSFGESREFSFPVPIKQKQAQASGTVYEDENNNGRFDAGEGVGGVTLTWKSRLYSETRRTTTTNAAGRFAVELPTGPYYVLGAAKGLVLDTHDVEVEESGVDGLLFEAMRPLNSVLAVQMQFTKDSYTRGEAPTVKVTLTNKSDLSLPKIVAKCDHGPEHPNLTGKNWGALTEGGVTVPPGTTTTVEVTEPMPALANNFGYVRVDCEFSQAGVDYGANPRASDEATFPGRKADLTVAVTTSGEASGFRVVLTKGKDECPVVAETKTGPDGKAILKDVPVGRYQLYVVPPTKKWFFKKGNTTGAEAVANRDNGYNFVAWEQSEDNPALAQPPSCPGGGGPGTNPPAPQGSTGSGLAYTGASLVIPGIAGLIAVVAGIGVLALTRRRRTTS